jgi:hypothetical protein
VFVLDFLGGRILLLLSLFGTAFKTEYQLDSGILGNTVVYQSVVISIMIADSGMGIKCDLPARVLESTSWRPE